MPHLDYAYFGVTANGNCAPALAGVAAAPGVPAPNLLGLAGLAGAALPGLAGINAGGLGFMPALAGCIPYSWAALCNATLFTGLFPVGMHPAYEIHWRFSNLRIAASTQAGHLGGTPILPQMERQERIHLSYAMGMNLAVYASRAANFTFPMHFSRYTAFYGPGSFTLNAAFANAYRPDIVFPDLIAGTCQVWEAKGRTGVNAAGLALGGVATGVLDGAMDQARKLATLFVPGVGMVAPNAYIASLARLNPGNLRWHLHVADPPNGGQKRAREEVDDVAKEAFYREFYRPHVEMVADTDETVTFGGITYAVAQVPGSSVRIGLDQRIKALFTESRSRSPEAIVTAIESYIAAGYPQDSDNTERFVSREGIFTDATEDDLGQPPA